MFFEHAYNLHSEVVVIWLILIEAVSRGPGRTTKAAFHNMRLACTGEDLAPCLQVAWKVTEATYKRSNITILFTLQECEVGLGKILPCAITHHQLIFASLQLLPLVPYDDVLLSAMHCHFQHVELWKVV